MNKIMECPLCLTNTIKEEIVDCLFCDGEGCQICKDTGKTKIVSCANENCILNEDFKFNNEDE
jgi:hypothetical protein